MKTRELQNEVIKNLWDILIILMADTAVNTKEQKMKKEEMENDNEVMCHEEGMSWKTTILWQAKWQKQKESTEELVLSLFTMSTLMSTTMSRALPERIKDENETSINVTWLRYHPTSLLSMLNESKSYQNGSSLMSPLVAQITMLHCNAIKRG